MASRLGTSLKSARERRGWSRAALAHVSGLSWSAITQIETGRRQEVRASTLVALASALGVSVDYLLGSAATMSPLVDHDLVTYSSDDDYLAAAVPYIRDGIERGDSVLAVTPKRHADLLHDVLEGEAQQVDFLDSSAWYRSLPSAASGYRDYVNERFERGAPWIRIIGEPVWTGRTGTALTEWFRYEALINVSFASSPASVVCTYDTRVVPDGAMEAALRTHPHLMGDGDVTASATYQEPEDFLLTLS